MTELAALLRLCDDPSPAIAAKIAARLRELAPDGEIWIQIEAQNLEATLSQRAILQAIFAAPAVSDADENARETRLRAAWRDLRFDDDDTSLLESALLALGDWQCGAGTGARGRDALDELALEFGDFEMPSLTHSDIGMPESTDDWSEAAALAYFLFEFKQLRGAPQGEYYHPLQSNLTVALESGTGLPITLACIFILVGRRVGLSIEGCPFPGHFLTRDGQSQRFFDPFNGAKALSAREVNALQRAAPGAMSEAAPATEIVARVLRNLSVAYYQSGEVENSALMLSLLEITAE